MIGRLRSAGAAALLAALLAGCMSSPGPGERGPNSENMSADQFGQTDFNRTVTLEVRDNLASLYVLLDKLYRRNPRKWRKTGAADQARKVHAPRGQGGFDPPAVVVAAYHAGVRRPQSQRRARRERRRHLAAAGDGVVSQPVRR